MTFAKRLRQLRIQRGLSQEALALACGWSGQSRIANYESTKPKARQPKPDELPLLARALGVPVGAFFEGPDMQSQDPGLDIASLSEALKALDIEEGLQGKMGLRARGARLGELYAKVRSNGGKLPEAILRELMNLPSKSEQGGDDGRHHPTGGTR